MAEAVRIAARLDVKDGRLVKGVRFQRLREVGDPVEFAESYQEQGADELAVLDVMATVEKRRGELDVWRSVAEAVELPLTFGGGIASLSDIERALDAGASRVSIGSAAMHRPAFIEEAATEFGPERIVVAIDAEASDEVPGGYEVYIEGGRRPTRVDAFAFARAAEDRGAGALLVTSIAADGTKGGFDIPLIRGIAERVRAPVMASGGAGKPEHFHEAATEGRAAVLVAASALHFGEVKIPEVRDYLREKQVEATE